MQSKLNFLFSDPNMSVGASSPEDDENSYEVCIANISPAERQKRLKFGVIQFVVSLAILAVLLVTGVDRFWRVILFLPFAAAFTGYFQWRDKT